MSLLDSGMVALVETDVGLKPDDWDLVEFGTLVDQGAVWLQNGFSCSNRNQNGTGLPHVRPMNIDETGQITLSGLNYVQPDRGVSHYFLKPGDVVFNNTNSEELVGKTALWTLEGEYGISNHMTIMRVQDVARLHPYYLATRLHKLWSDGYSRTLCRRYVNQAGISLERIRSIPIPLPPLPEQRRIATVLTAIQDAIAAQEDVIAAARAFKRSLMQRLFTYGPGREPAPTKETEIGEIPAHWNLARLGDIADVQSGNTPSRTRPEYYLNGTIPWVKTLDLNNGLVVSTEEMITRQALVTVKSKIRPVGTVMVAMYGGAGTIGKSGILGIPATTNQAVCCIEPNTQRFDSIYLHNYMVKLRPRWMLYAIGTRKDPNISKTIIENEAVPLPPIVEQQSIADMLSVIDAKIAAEEDRKTALEALFKSMLHQLMTGQLRLLTNDGLPYLQP